MRSYQSASSCNIYDLCPQKYKFKYVDKLPDPSGPAAELGTRIHNAIYATWAERKAEHSDLFIKIALTALYTHREVQALPAARIIDGKASEHKIDVPCGKTQLNGYIDMMLEDGSLVDFKTSKSLFSSEKIQEQRQHLFYVYGALKMGWLPPNQFPYLFRYVVVTTAKSPTVQVIKFNVSQSALEEFERDFNLRTYKIQLSHDLNMFPHNPGSHCYMCPYKNICPAHQSHQ